MENIGIISLAILIANALITYMGLKESAFLEKYAFKIKEILFHKEYIRLISSGFLHVNWLHFGLNMLTLYIFSESLEADLGILYYLLIYFGSLIGGNLFALFVHRNHENYSAVGASGAVSGLVFASIGLYPGMELGLLLIPIFIPAWLFGLLYVAYSIYGIKSQRDNIGHEAHLGGGVIGLLIAILIDSSILRSNPLPIALILIPSLTFLFFIIKKPHLLMTTNSFKKSEGVPFFEDKYNAKKMDKQAEIDAILDKISKHGYKNLSKKDRDRLKELNN